MKLKINNKYRTRSGRIAKIIAISSDDVIYYPIWALIDGYIERYDHKGRSQVWRFDDTLDLVEKVQNFDSFRVDDPVMVRESKDSLWVKRYFSHVDNFGRACTFIGGVTSWTVDPSGDCTINWNYCRSPTKEEK